MLQLNKVFASGNVVKDPQLRYTPDGIAVSDIRVAINYGHRQQNGELYKETCFIDVEVWRKGAEVAAEQLKKGSAVFIVGRLKQDEWVDKEGKKRSKIKILAEKIQPLQSVNIPSNDVPEQTEVEGAEGVEE
jgi:single-strand DNA-binding protein